MKTCSACPSRSSCTHAEMSALNDRRAFKHGRTCSPVSIRSLVSHADSLITVKNSFCRRRVGCSLIKHGALHIRSRAADVRDVGPCCTPHRCRQYCRQSIDSSAPRRKANAATLSVRLHLTLVCYSRVPASAVTNGEHKILTKNGKDKNRRRISAVLRYQKPKPCLLKS